MFVPLRAEERMTAKTPIRSSSTSEVPLITSSPSPSGCKEQPSNHPPLQFYRTPIHSSSRYSGVSDSGGGGSNFSGSRLWRSSSSGSGGGGGGSRYFRRTPRPNPFDSHLSTDRLRLPILSPSVFSTVQSPSQDKDSSGRFWSVDQQAKLFPAEISDDSPWKQETATSVLDADSENRTQEAIDLYFSHNHDVKSPDDQLLSVTSIRPPLACSSLDLGSPVLVAPSISRRSSDSAHAVTAASSMLSTTSAAAAGTRVSQWTQTSLTLPPNLPADVERVLNQYMRFHEIQDQQPKEPVPPIDEPCNLSTSTLRRKLFEGMIEDSSDEGEEEEEEENKDQECQESEGDKIVVATTAAAADHLMSSPIKKDDLLSPEQFPLTPISKMARFNSKNPTWSSSPISSKNGRRTSLSPPSGGLQISSPTFSPIRGTDALSATKTNPHSTYRDDDDDNNKEN